MVDEVGNIRNVVHGLKPVILMVIVQFTFAGVNVFYKLAAADHFNLRILVAYRFLFSAAFIAPIALYVERGAMLQNMYAQSIVYTSVTFVAATTNLIPAITFVMALSFGLEKLGWKTAAGKAKILGTLMGLGGAMLLTFYNGVDINIWKSPVDLLTLVQAHSQHVATSHHDSPNKVLGALLALASVVSFALWLIIQAKMAEKYPCPYSSTALMLIMGSVQGIAFALCTERDWSQWKLGWNFRLLTVAYSGILASGVMFSFIAWCNQMRGPLFVSVFNPLMLVLAAIAGSLLLEEQLHLGSVLGSALIVFGLYVVLWGKGKEMKKMLQLVPEGIPLPAKGIIESKRVETDLSCLTENITPTNHHSNHLSDSEVETAAIEVRLNIVED